MALVLTIKDAVFTNYVTVLTPPINAYAQFKFGGDLAQSTTDKSGSGHNLSTLGSTTGIAYTADTIKLPQIANGHNTLVLNGLASQGSFTLAYKIESGLHEKLGIMPDVSGLLVESAGIVALSIAAASNSTNTMLRAATPVAITRPIVIIATVDVSVANTIKLSVRTQDAQGYAQTATETFSGTLNSSFAAQAIRLGSARSGSLELNEFVAYNRVLNTSEQDALIAYLSQ